MNKKGYARILESVLAGILMVSFLTYTSQEISLERSSPEKLENLGNDTLIVLDSLPHGETSFMYYSLKDDPNLFYDKIGECLPDNVVYAVELNDERYGRETDKESVICRYVKVVDNETFVYKIRLYLWYK
ncbi:MAG: hypothetical protein U9N35_03685 [Euryarchaeota archaeon]|nr:hypothetical protein [Euryarchaeota archaeon]